MSDAHFTVDADGTMTCRLGHLVEPGDNPMQHLHPHDELEKLRAEVQFGQYVIRTVDEVLIRALGAEVADGSGGGTAEDVALIVRQRDDARAERDRLAALIERTARELQGLVSRYTRGPGVNGDRVADLLSADAYRIGTDLRAAVDPTPVHLCPPGGEYIAPCCGRPIAELPRAERITLDADTVTCTGRIAP